MELNAGICTICSSNNEVVKSEDCSVFWELINKICKEDIPNLNEYEINVKICPSCVYKITLIDSKKAILFNEPKEINSNNCRLCDTQVATKLFKVGHSKALKDVQPYKTLQQSGSAICSECYFVMEYTFSLRNSIKKLCKFRNLKRKSIENAEKPPDVPPDTLPIQMKEIPENPSPDTTTEVEHEEKENQTTKSLVKARQRIQKNGQKITDTPEKSSPKTKSKKPELAVADEKDESLDKCELRTKTLKNKKPSTPNGDMKITTPRKNARSPKIKPTDSAISRVKLVKKDSPQLSNLVPLCAINMELSEEIKADNKFFKLIPYIKLLSSIGGLKKQKGRQINGASIPKIISTGPRETKPSGKRTPPIKIKFRQGKANIGVKSKKIKTEPVEEDKRKMVVKVARLKLSKSGSDQSEEEEEINEINDVVVVDEELNSSKDLSTPKKKKKVHFNDTPTIIITGDDISDQEEPDHDTDMEEVDLTNEVLEESEPVNALCSQESDTVDIQDDDKQENNEDKIDLEENYEEKVEETSENKIEEAKDTTELIENNEVVENQQIFEIKDLEDETQNQESENIDKENEVESIRQITDDENGLDDKSSSDQNSIDKDTALLDLDIIDECSNDEDVEKRGFSMDTQSTLGKIIDTNDDNDVIINNEMLSDAADDKENFGSLIDEVQKCLTSSDDFTGLSKKQDAGCPTEEILDDDSLTCLQDLEVLKGSFTEELIADNDIVDKLTLGSKRGASSTSSEVSPKKSRFN